MFWLHLLGVEQILYSSKHLVSLAKLPSKYNCNYIYDVQKLGTYLGTYFPELYKVTLFSFIYIRWSQYRIHINLFNPFKSKKHKTHFKVSFLCKYSTYLGVETPNKFELLHNNKKLKMHGSKFFLKQSGYLLDGRTMAPPIFRLSPSVFTHAFI